jgi:hypothetical protein
MLMYCNTATKRIQLGLNFERVHVYSTDFNGKNRFPVHMYITMDYDEFRSR